jgi:hypothetical protein
VVSGDGNSIDQSHTVNIYYGLPPDQPAPNRSDRNEKTLINAVWTEVDDRLRQSLHNAILIRLDMAEQRSQVSRPWDSELRTADQNAKPLPPDTPIAEVFDRRDVGGKLLVLGNPGAGKTTTMLDLAAALVQRANANPDEPIPVMVNLSSWQNPKQPFADWLLHKLRTNYPGFSQKLWQTWLADKKLLPLLDGLDELPPARQEAAVQGLNTWLQSDTGVPRLLVCSRREEYELYATKLDLNGAICLSPLTNGQLRDYLASLKMAHLWDTLQHDQDLLGLVRTPLLLSVSTLANEELDAAQWGKLQTTQERLDYLLGAYVRRQLHEPVNSKEYPPHKQPTAQQTRRWLVWLAQHLQTQSEDEFLIEKMQPAMLATDAQRKKYISQATLLGSVIYSSPSLLCTLLSANNFIDPVQLIRTFMFIVFLFLPISFIFLIINSIKINFNEDIMTNERMGYSFRRAKEKTFSAFVHPLAFHARKVRKSFENEWKEFEREWRQFTTQVKFRLLAIFLALTFLIFLFYYMSKEFVDVGPILRLIASVAICALLSAPYFGIERVSLNYKRTPNQGIWESLKNALKVSIIIQITFFALGVSFGLSVASFSNLTGASPDLLIDSSNKYLWGIMYGYSFWILGFLFFAPIGGFVGGLNACVKHLSLRILLFQECFIPWNYARFLNHCTDRLLLQRVGGRYRFIHRLVQEHFAAMPLEQVK